MGILNRVENGLIYFNDFDTINLDPILMVSVNDSSRYTIGNGNLVLHHGSVPIILFLKIIENNYVAVMKNDYNPTISGDEGGLIVFQDEDSKIEELEYYDSTKGISNTYPYLKIEKNELNYYAYWSNDEKEWNLLSSTSLIFAGENLGCVLYGSSGEDLSIDFLKVYKSNYIKLLGLLQGTKVELYDSNNNLQSSFIVDNSEFYVRAPYYPFTGYFKFYSLDGQTSEQSETIQMWGGDSFIKEFTLDIYYNNTEVYGCGEIELGDLKSTVETSFNVVNNTSYTFTNVVIQVVQYDNNNGYKLASVSLDTQPLNYCSAVSISQIKPNDNYKIWVEVSKQDAVTISGGIGEFSISISFD
jgi:hypothetical protein